MNWREETDRIMLDSIRVVFILAIICQWIYFLFGINVIELISKLHHLSKERVWNII